MRTIDLKTICHLVLFVSLSFSVDAQDHSKKANDHATGVKALSADVRQLLSQEMLAIEKAMQQIVSASAKGDWRSIETLGLKIKQSFILKQQLTQAQIHQLHSKLPEDFLKQDQQFHYFAGMLAHAAKMEKAELVNFYFSQMNRACMNCHAEHAPDRFPGFADKQHPEDAQEHKQNDHHH